MRRQTAPAKLSCATGRTMFGPLLIAAALALPGVSARAAITGFDVYKNNSYNQTGATQPTTVAGSFFNSRLFEQNTTDVGTVSANSPVVGTVAYSKIDPTTFFYSSPLFGSQAAMDAAYPALNPYSIATSGGTVGAQSATITLMADSFSGAVPYLTGGSYASLQGLNAASADNLTINGFTAPANATEAYVFATITKVSDGSVAYTQGFLSPSTTSLAIAAGTLAAGTAYNLELDYSVRFNSANPGFGGVTATQAFDQRTEIAFTTASPSASVPEPASLALMGIGLACAYSRRAFRKARGRSIGMPRARPATDEVDAPRAGQGAGWRFIQPRSRA